MKLLENLPYSVIGGNTVVFHTFDGESITYVVKEGWLHCYDGVPNDSIFNMIGILSIAEMASNAYGYHTVYDERFWPMYVLYDYEAASRIVTALAQHCKGVEIY